MDNEVSNRIQGEFELRIGELLTKAIQSKATVAETAFTVIGGVAEGLSKSIWQYLYGAGYLNSDGRVDSEKLGSKFTVKSGDGFGAIIENAVLNVVLAQNWLAGAGLFDGNCPGERGQLNKRDFGLLVGQAKDGQGKYGQLLAGIGVPDEKDYQLLQDAAFGQWHLGILTRVKDTGETRLYLDAAPPKRDKIARNVSLKDAKQFTIGAENNGGNYFTGDIGEIVVLDTVPDDAQLATLQRFLARKWGIKL